MSKLNAGFATRLIKIIRGGCVEVRQRAVFCASSSTCENKRENSVHLFFFYPLLTQERSLPIGAVGSRFTQVPVRAASRTSTRSSVFLVQPRRKKSRRPTTRFEPAWPAFRVCFGSTCLHCYRLSLRWPKSTTLTPTKTTHKRRKSLPSWLKLMRFTPQNSHFLFPLEGIWISNMCIYLLVGPE